MTFTRTMYASTLAAGVGLAGLLGIGLATASADPGQCNAPGQPPCGQNQHDGPGNGNWGPNGNQAPNDGHAPVDWQQRGVDQGRQDHQPFNWNGQQVTPVPAGNGQGWGFWFGPVWIPL